MELKIFIIERNRIPSPVLVRLKVFEQKVRFELLFSNQSPRAKVLVFWSYDQIGKKNILFKDVFSKTPLNGFKHWEGKNLLTFLFSLESNHFFSFFSSNLRSLLLS